MCNDDDGWPTKPEEKQKVIIKKEKWEKNQ